MPLEPTGSYVTGFLGSGGGGRLLGLCSPLTSPEGMGQSWTVIAEESGAVFC